MMVHESGGISVPVIEKLQSLCRTDQLTVQPGTDGQCMVLAVPKGFDLRSVKLFLNEYLVAPERKTGRADFEELDSFVEHVNRTKDSQSVIFASKVRKNPSLLAVYNYNFAESQEGLPRFGDHQAFHGFPLSDEWKSWVSRDGQRMAQFDFAVFLEDRILDVADPSLATARTKEILVKMGNVTLATPTQLLIVSNGLSVHVASKMTNAVKIDSGEVQMSWETEHQDDKGNRLVVPGAFLILVPLFQGGDLYPVIARLRYRAERGTVTWFYNLYRVEEMFELAIKTAIDKVREKTGLPVFFGSPEVSIKTGNEDD